MSPDTDIFLIVLDCREEIVSAVRQLSNFFYTVREASATPLKELDERSANVLMQLPTVTLKARQRLLRILVVDNGSDDFPGTTVIPLFSTISAGRSMPIFNPKWLSILKKNARL